MICCSLFVVRCSFCSRIFKSSNLQILKRCELCNNLTELCKFFGLKNSYFCLHFSKQFHIEALHQIHGEYPL